MKKILLIAVVLIICCGLLEAVEGTSITECKTQSSVEGLTTWLLLPLPINLWEEESFVHVTRLARNSSDLDVPVLDGSWNSSKKDVDVKITPRASRRNYEFGGFCGNKTVLLIITKMSPFHEGTYEVQTNQPQNASKVEWPYCNLTMTTAPKKPVTVPDETTSCTRALQDIAEKLSNLVELYNTLKADVYWTQVYSFVVAAVIFLIVYLLINYWRPLLQQLLHCIQRKKRKDDRSTNKATNTASNRFAGYPTEEEGENLTAVGVTEREDYDH